jgi:hypothetical protein
MYSENVGSWRFWHLLALGLSLFGIAWHAIILAANAAIRPGFYGPGCLYIQANMENHPFFA